MKSKRTSVVYCAARTHSNEFRYVGSTGRKPAPPIITNRDQNPKFQIKVKVKARGQECPRYTDGILYIPWQIQFLTYYRLQ
jgi:hypothetical protein